MLFMKLKKKKFRSSFFFYENLLEFLYMEENKNLETQNEVSEQVEKIQEEVVQKEKGFLTKNKV